MDIGREVRVIEVEELDVDLSPAAAGVEEDPVLMDGGREEAG